MAKQYTQQAGEGRLSVRGLMTRTEGGLVLQLYGGTLEHVGSVTVSTAAPTLGDPNRLRATSSVINIPPHKEELVARPASERLALLTGVPVVCIAGLHVDDATGEEIQALETNAAAVVEALAAALERELEGEKWTKSD